jgi:DNA repair protein RecN (Recombination protein N)
MLTTLRIKNLALVADLTLELQPGYNVITGETGAGKSILIGALNLVLGGRADRHLIRSGADLCTVEAVFEIPPLAERLVPWFEENGLEPCEAGRLLLKRSLTGTGTNRQFINGSPTSLAALSALGDRLVDIHGPHDHQSLLHPVRQLDILDAFGGLDPRRATFARHVRELETLLARRAALIVDEPTYHRQLELFRHQVREIDEARLCQDEEEELRRDHERVRNAARLLELCQAALAQLSDEETSLRSGAGRLGRLLLELQRLDPAAAPIAALHEETVAMLSDLEGQLSRYADRIDLDPAHLQQLEERLDLVQSLKRKYGPTLRAVLAFADEARHQLAALEGRQAELERLDKEQARLEMELTRQGSELHGERHGLVPRLHEAIRAELRDLGFIRSHFEVVLTSRLPDPAVRPMALPTPTGFDTVEFQFGPNPGEPSRPLRAIASSGELARVMLALKTVLAVQDEIPVLVFDEVDANVAGETAHAVGRKLREIGRHRQVLCITHLAPVAACAGAHFVVTKDIRNDRTITDLRPVKGDDRVAELARMLGGGSQVALQHAQALLESGAPSASPQVRAIEGRRGTEPLTGRARRR